MAGKSTGPEEVELHDHRFSFEGVDGALLVEAVAACFARGMPVRLAPVGFGIVLRVSVFDAQGWQAGFNVTNGDELAQVLRAVALPDAEEWLQRRMEAPRTRRRR